MPICKKCGGKFPNYVKIKGKRKNISSRWYCLECNPYGERRFYGGEKPTKTWFIDENGKRKLRYRTFTCKTCGIEYTQQTSGLECSKCKGKKVFERSKKRSIEYKSGKCEICGYDRSQTAMDFHHIDPKHKDFQISRRRGCCWEKIKKELDKCYLLCSNCHREYHEGLFCLIVEKPFLKKGQDNGKNR